MKNLWQKIGIALALLAGWTACEKVNFPQDLSDADTGGAGTGEVLDTDSTGMGTASAPAVVEDLKKRETDFLGRSCWVMGYIVGYTERTMKNATFTAEGAVQSNVLLADSPREREPGNCVPVELKTDKWKKQLSLAYKPENLGKKVAVHGLINKYFSVAGVRDMDDFAWVENSEEPDVSEDGEQEPEENPKPDGDGTLNPEPDEKPQKPEEPTVEEPGEETVFYLNRTALVKVERAGALRTDGRYMIGTVPDRKGMVLIAASLKYGTGQTYRTVIGAQEVSEEHFETEQGVDPAVFILEESGTDFRLKDALTGAYLAYDVRGDISSTSWLPLYSLLPEELDRNYCAGFQIDPSNEKEQVRTAQTVKYSEVDRRTCLLRYNSGGRNFKLNYQKNGLPVCLYLLK